MSDEIPYRPSWAAGGDDEISRKENNESKEKELPALPKRTPKPTDIDKFTSEPEAVEVEYSRASRPEVPDRKQFGGFYAPRAHSQSPRQELPDPIGKKGFYAPRPQSRTQSQVDVNQNGDIKPDSVGSRGFYAPSPQQSKTDPEPRRQEPDSTGSGGVYIPRPQSRKPTEEEDLTSPENLRLLQQQKQLHLQRQESERKKLQKQQQQLLEHEQRQQRKRQEEQDRQLQQQLQQKEVEKEQERQQRKREQKQREREQRHEQTRIDRTRSTYIDLNPFEFEALQRAMEDSPSPPSTPPLTGMSSSQHSSNDHGSLSKLTGFFKGVPMKSTIQRPFGVIREEVINRMEELNIRWNEPQGRGGWMVCENGTAGSTDHVVFIIEFITQTGFGAGGAGGGGGSSSSNSSTTITTCGGSTTILPMSAVMSASSSSSSSSGMWQTKLHIMKEKGNGHKFRDVGKEIMEAAKYEIKGGWKIDHSVNMWGMY